MNNIIYILQISADSTFSNLVCADTCLSDTLIKMEEILCFNDIKRELNYYWGVKAVVDNGRQEVFSKCRQAFSFSSMYVELNNFYAKRTEDEHVSLNWQANYIEKNLGFNVYRSNSIDGNYIKVNNAIISGKNTYSFIDASVKLGQSYAYKLEEITIKGRSKFHSPIVIEMPIPKNYELSQNYPNPFNTETIIKYQIPVKTHVHILIFDVLGRKIRTLVDEQKDPGFYSINWDSIDDDRKPVVSGIYFYQLRTNQFKATRKMTIVR